MLNFPDRESNSLEHYCTTLALPFCHISYLLRSVSRGHKLMQGYQLQCTNMYAALLQFIYFIFIYSMDRLQNHETNVYLLIRAALRSLTIPRMLECTMQRLYPHCNAFPVSLIPIMQRCSCRTSARISTCASV